MLRIKPSHNHAVGQSLSLSTWLFFATTGIVVGYFLLEARTLEEFRGIVTFVHIFGISLLIMVFLAVITPLKHRMRGENSQFFFNQKIPIKKLIWLGFGIAGVFGISYLAVQVDSKIIGILGSGAFLSIAFFKTNSAIIPILIHGIYNSTVVWLRGIPNSFLSSSPIYVPDIGVSNEFLGEFGSEVILQIFLIATAEEMFRILIISFFIVAQEGSFSTKGIMKWLGGMVAVAIWSSYHYVQNPNLFIKGIPIVQEFLTQQLAWIFSLSIIPI